MKILSLEILDSAKQLIRKISFQQKGLSVIFGDVEKKENEKDTSNSIGKTIVLRFIDVLYGAEAKMLVGKLNGYSIKGVLLFNQEEYVVTKTIGDSSYFINNKQYSKNEYRSFFGIERSVQSKFIQLSNRTNLVSKETNPNKADVSSALSVLDLSDVSLLISEIYDIQDQITEFGKSIKKVLESMNVSSKDAENTEYLNKKHLEELRQKEREINEEIKTLSFNSRNDLIQKEFEADNCEVKSKRQEKYVLIEEKKQLETFLQDLNVPDITAEDISYIYSQAKIELPDFVKTTIDEVNEFYESIVGDRKKAINKRISEINNNVLKLDNEIDLISQRLDNSASILSKNAAYQNGIAILSEVQTKLQEESIIFGKFQQYRELINKKSELESTLTRKFEALNEEEKKVTTEINEYKDFVYDTTKKLYSKSIDATFNISFRSLHKTKRPVLFEFEITGDDGAGVGEVKNMIFDLLLFSHSKCSDILIEDSSCFDSVDPRQVERLVLEINQIAINQNKQALISINKYQVRNESILTLLLEHQVLKLSSSDLLLGKRI